MKETFVQIYSSMKEIGVELLTQWIGGSKQKLLENFKKNAEKSVLFWTDSFWEWVDIPGSDVEVLVIHKFPFMVPTDPIFQARSRLFHDSFLEYSVPAMILKLKQGIGRLIRTKTDKGIIVILDKRIDSRWWQLVRESFPAGIPVRSGISADFLRLLSSKK
jgi:DNA polymerase-3 subunit epsilon/ATP-dependent DNA helicase DinG